MAANRFAEFRNPLVVWIAAWAGEQVGSMASQSIERRLVIRGKETHAKLDTIQFYVLRNR